LILAIIRLNKDNIFEIAEKNGWKGQGIESDPLIISKVENMNLNLVFNGIEFSILLFNCKVNSIKLISCQHFIINQNHVTSLYLRRSFFNIIKSNLINNVRTKFCGKNIYTENRLSKKALTYLHKELWKRDFLKRVIIVILTIFIIVVPLYIHSLIFLSNINFIPIFLIIAGIISLIYFIYYFLLIKWSIKTYPADKIIKNKEINSKKTLIIR